jgi:hypothetical protein
MAEDIEELRVKTGDGAKRPRCQLYPQYRKCAALPGTSQMGHNRL